MLLTKHWNPHQWGGYHRQAVLVKALAIFLADGQTIHNTFFDRDFWMPTVAWC
jgi:hypothetical protein